MIQDRRSRSKCLARIAPSGVGLHGTDHLCCFDDVQGSTVAPEVLYCTSTGGAQGSDAYLTLHM